MRVSLLWLTALAGVAGIWYSAQHSKEFRGQIDRWLTEFRLEKQAADTTARGQRPEDKSATHRSTPRPRIPKKAKPSVFEKLDTYARNTPSDKAKTIETLSAYLNKPASNQLERARMIYTWVATHIHYDDYGYTLVCQGYSVLFNALATAMGLEAKTIVG